MFVKLRKAILSSEAALSLPTTIIGILSLIVGTPLQAGLMIIIVSSLTLQAGIWRRNHLVDINVIMMPILLVVGWAFLSARNSPDPVTHSIGICALISLLLLADDF
jgi:hypothetical protein